MPLIVLELVPEDARVYAPVELKGTCLTREGQKFDLTITRRSGSHQVPDGIWQDLGSAGVGLKGASK